MNKLIAAIALIATCAACQTSRTSLASQASQASLTSQASQASLEAHTDTLTLRDTLRLWAQADTIYQVRTATRTLRRIIRQTDTLLIVRHDTLRTDSTAITPAQPTAKTAAWRWGVVVSVAAAVITLAAAGFATRV